MAVALSTSGTGAASALAVFEDKSRAWKFDSDSDLKSLVALVNVTPEQIEAYKTCPNVESTFHDLANIGDVLGLAMASAGDNQCNVYILQVQIKYKTLVIDALAASTSFVSTCLSACKQIQLAYKLARNNKFDSMQKQLAKCSDAAGKMADISDSLIGMSQKLYDETSTAISQAVTDTNTTAKKREDIKELMEQTKAAVTDLQTQHEEKDKYLKEYEKEVKAMQAQTEQLNNQILEQTKDVERLASQHAEWLTSSAASYHDELFQAQDADREEWIKQKEEVEKKRKERIEQHTAEKKELRAKYDQQAETLKQEHSQKSKVYKEGQDGLNLQVDSAQAEVAKLQSRVASLAASKVKAEAEKTLKRTDLTTAKTNLKDAKDLLDQATAKANADSGFVKGMKNTGNGIKKIFGGGAEAEPVVDLEAAEKDIERCQGQVTEMETALKAVDPNKFDAQLTTAKEQLAEQQSKLTNLQKKQGQLGLPPVQAQPVLEELSAVSFVDLVVPPEPKSGREADRVIQKRNMLIDAKKQEIQTKQQGLEKAQQERKEMLKQRKADVDAKSDKLMSLQKETAEVKGNMLGALQSLKSEGEQKDSLTQAIKSLNVATQALGRVMNTFGSVKQFWLMVQAHCNQIKDNMSEDNLQAFVDLAECGEEDELYSELNSFLMHWAVLGTMNVRARNAIQQANDNVSAFFAAIPGEEDREKYCADKIAHLEVALMQSFKADEARIEDVTDKTEALKDGEE